MHFWPSIVKQYLVLLVSCVVYFYHITKYTIKVDIALNRMHISSRVVNTVLSWGIIVYRPLS